MNSIRNFSCLDNTETYLWRPTKWRTQWFLSHVVYSRCNFYEATVTIKSSFTLESPQYSNLSPFWGQKWQFWGQTLVCDLQKARACAKTRVLSYFVLFIQIFVGLNCGAWDDREII